VTSSERDHQTRWEHFSIGGQWWSWIYLAQIRRYGTSKILRSRVWPFGVTWRHRSRDRWTRHMWFPIGGPLEPCVYLTPLRRYLTPEILGSRLWPFRLQKFWGHEFDLLGSRDVIGHVTIELGKRGFLLVVHWNHCVYLAPLRIYKASKLHLPMLKAKSSVRMRRVTWRVGRGSKITTYLKFPSH